MELPLLIWLLSGKQVSPPDLVEGHLVLNLGRIGASLVGFAQEYLFLTLPGKQASPIGPAEESLL